MDSKAFSEIEYAAFLHRLRGRSGAQPNEPKVKEERTWGRDIALLRKHRQWGWNVPALDIDFLEYDNEKAVALFEYKKSENWRDAMPNFDSNLRALIDLGNRAFVPVFVTFYSPDRTNYRVCPVNSCASSVFKRYKE